MTLYEKIVAAYPELNANDFGENAAIELRNDGDEKGDYIARWDYSLPIPKGLKLGK